MRFLFTTLQTYESEFYGFVSARARQRGARGRARDGVARSRACSARGRLRGGAFTDVLAELAQPDDIAAESARIEAEYGLPTSATSIAATTPSPVNPRRGAAARGRYVRALERVFDDVRPGCALPGGRQRDDPRRLAPIALQREIPVLFLLFTIFPKPLRLYADTRPRAVVEVDEVRELTDPERDELETFRRAFTARAEPIRDYRRVPIESRRVGCSPSMSAEAP